MRGSQMQVSPDQAQLLAMLVQILGAKRCIEVGVYTGYSSLAVALVLPESGVLVACERDKNSLEVAKRYYDRAGVSHKVDVRHGLAADTLNSMIENGEGCSYDFAFVDADKRMYQEYFELLLQLVRVGGLIVIDNVLWHGRVADPLVIDKKTDSIRSFNKALVDDERVSIIMVKKDDWDNFKRPASEQQYSAEVEDNSQLKPSQNELNDLGQACNKLWELDYNRLTPEKDYEIDCGEGKKTYQKQDMAEGSLFTWVNEDVLRKPTISRFCFLLDNYNPHEGYKEQVTSQEKQEQAAFIEEICRTAPIKYLHKYLCYKRIVSEDVQEFKRLLNSLWFDLYGRGGTSSCSSAFEHVFVGEIKERGEQSVSGFHNWLQFYMEEAKGRVDYQGYIFPRRRGETPDSETQLLTIQFEWNGVLKSVSSTMIGVSPEFELALYTLCFYMGGEDNHIELGPYYVNVKCYRLGNKLGSAFPIADE